MEINLTEEKRRREIRLLSKVLNVYRFYNTFVNILIHITALVHGLLMALMKYEIIFM